MEIILQRLAKIRGDRDGCVTILILLEIILQPSTKWLNVPPKSVTILILLEIILQLDKITRIKSKINKLQSLFYWKSFCNNITKLRDRDQHLVTILILLEIILQRLENIGGRNEREVTILILLEIILQQIRQYLFSDNTMRYNPYFIGNHSATFPLITLSPCLECYNPYFIGNHSATRGNN